MGPRARIKLITGVENLDADFVSLRRRDLDLFNLERLACAPADGGLALDGLASGVRHSGREQERG